MNTQRPLPQEFGVEAESKWLLPMTHSRLPLSGLPEWHSLTISINSLPSMDIVYYFKGVTKTGFSVNEIEYPDSRMYTIFCGAQIKFHSWPNWVNHPLWTFGSKDFSSYLEKINRSESAIWLITGPCTYLASVFYWGFPILKIDIGIPYFQLEEPLSI